MGKIVLVENRPNENVNESANTFGLGEPIEDIE
jgi:hypothetical protein